MRNNHPFCLLFVIVCCFPSSLPFPSLPSFPSFLPSFIIHSPSLFIFIHPFLSPQQDTYYYPHTIERWCSLHRHPHPGTHPHPRLSPSTSPHRHLQHPRATIILGTVPAPAMIAASTTSPPITPLTTLPPSQPRAHRTLLHHRHLLPSTPATSADTRLPNESRNGTATTAMDDCLNRTKSLHPLHHPPPHPLSNNCINNNLTRVHHSISISISISSTSTSSILIIINSINLIIASTTTRSTVNRRLRCMRAAAMTFSNIGL